MRQLDLAYPEAAYTGGRAVGSARQPRGCVYSWTRSAGRASFNPGGRAESPSSPPEAAYTREDEEKSNQFSNTMPRDWSQWTKVDGQAKNKSTDKQSQKPDRCSNLDGLREDEENTQLYERLDNRCWVGTSENNLQVDNFKAGSCPLSNRVQDRFTRPTTNSAVIANRNIRFPNIYIL